MKKSQLLLLAAIFFGIASLAGFLGRQWVFGLMFGSLAFLYGCLAYVKYKRVQKP